MGQFVLATTVLFACAGLGAAIDRLLRRSVKSRLHMYLTHLWSRINKIGVGDLAPALANKILTVTRARIGGRILSWNTLGVGAVISVLLTLTALGLGSAIVDVVKDWLQSHMNPERIASFDEKSRASMVAFFEQASVSFVPYARAHLWWLASLLVTNLVLDGVAVAVTAMTLEAITRTRGGLGLILILINAIVAVLTALACLAVSTFISIVPMSEAAVANKDIGVALQHWYQAIVVAFPYAFTTLFPILGFLCVLSFLVFMKPVVAAFRRISVYLLQRATEDEPEKLVAFSILGTAVGILMMGVVWLF